MSVKVALGPTPVHEEVDARITCNLNVYEIYKN